MSLKLDAQAPGELILIVQNPVQDEHDFVPLKKNFAMVLVFFH